MPDRIPPSPRSTRDAGRGAVDRGPWPALPPIRTGIFGLCPRCGKGHLFEGFLKLRKNCEACGLSYDFADPADGPAFFVICFGCVPAVAFALILQVKLDPPMWVHLVTSLPFLLLTCILPLRPLKGGSSTASCSSSQAKGEWSHRRLRCLAA